MTNHHAALLHSPDPKILLLHMLLLHSSLCLSFFSLATNQILSSASEKQAENNKRTRHKNKNGGRISPPFSSLSLVLTLNRLLFFFRSSTCVPLRVSTPTHISKIFLPPSPPPSLPPSFHLTSSSPPHTPKTTRASTPPGPRNPPWPRTRSSTQAAHPDTSPYPAPPPPSPTAP